MQQPISQATDPRVVSALEELISAKFSRPAKQTRAEMMKCYRKVKTGEGNRQYSHHWLSIEGRDEPLSLFLKLYRGRQIGEWNAAISKINVSDLTSPKYFGSFPVPSAPISKYMRPISKYFGVVPAYEGSIGVWEWTDYNVSKSLKLLSAKENLKRAILAIARINALPLSHPELNSCNLPHGAPWPNRPDRWFRSALRETALKIPDELAGEHVEKRVERILAKRPEFAARMAEQGYLFLTHHDLHAKNLVLLNDGRISVFDWDSASLNVAGPDLLFLFGRHKDNRQFIVDYYVECLAGLGARVTPENVRWNAELIEGFKRLAGGVRDADMERIRYGLATLERVLGLETDVIAAPAESQ
jgi:hypothetical protein